MEKMPILGVELEESPKFTWEEDLMWFDGPLISVYRYIELSPYLFLWVDTDDEKNRWLVVPTSELILEKMKANEITFREVILHYHKFMLCDDYNNTITKYYDLDEKDLPDDYLPVAGVYLYGGVDHA